MGIDLYAWDWEQMSGGPDVVKLPNSASGASGVQASPNFGMPTSLAHAASYNDAGPAGGYANGVSWSAASISANGSGYNRTADQTVGTDNGNAAWENTGLGGTVNAGFFLYGNANSRRVYRKQFHSVDHTRPQRCGARRLWHGRFIWN